MHNLKGISLEKRQGNCAEFEGGIQTQLNPISSCCCFLPRIFSWNNAPISSGKNPKMRQPWFSFFCSSDRFVDNKFYTLHLDFLLFPEGKNKSGSLIRFLSFIYCFSQKIIRQSQKYKKTKGVSIQNTKIIWWLHLTLRLRYGGGEGTLPSCCVWKQEF